MIIIVRNDVQKQHKNYGNRFFYSTMNKNIPTTFKCSIVKFNGTIIDQNVARSKMKLKHLQDIVGGNIEIVMIANDVLMLVNEDGLNLGLPHNKAATDMCDPVYGSDVFGDAFVCPIKLFQNKTNN